MPVWYNGGMSLFSHYQDTGKPFPCGDGGFLEPNFHREWVFALGRNRFDMRNEQNIRTWQREWSGLSDDAKKAAMANLITMIGNKRIDASLETAQEQPMDLLRAMEPYLSSFSNQDAVAWTTAFMSSELSSRRAQNHVVPTLSFAAHLLDWIRENRPSALSTTVAMLEDWAPLNEPKLYKDDSFWPETLERLAAVLPNTRLESTSAIGQAISGDDALLARVLSRANTDTRQLYEHALGMVEATDALLGVLSNLVVAGKSDVFMANARGLGEHLLDHYLQGQASLAVDAPKERLKGQAQRTRFDFFIKLTQLGVDCAQASMDLFKKHGTELSLPRYFHCLGELSQGWGPEQHKSFFAYWEFHGGLFVKEDLFGGTDIRKALLMALAKLPIEWSEWFESEYHQQLKNSVRGLMDPNNNGLDLPTLRWFYARMPDMYKHWIRGLPADATHLMDPELGEVAWEYTRAGHDSFLFQATLDWVKAPEMAYDARHEGYTLARLAWERRGVDLESSLQEAMLDKECDYRSLAMEAIAPSEGKNRWRALMGILDSFQEPNASASHWSEQTLVQEVLRTCIAKRLHPEATQEYPLGDVSVLFA